MLTSYSGFICRWKSFSSVWHVTKEMHVDLISAWSDNIIVLNMLAAAEFADHFIGICIVWNLSSIFKDSLLLLDVIRTDSPSKTVRPSEPSEMTEMEVQIRLSEPLLSSKNRIRTPNTKFDFSRTVRTDSVNFQFGHVRGLKHSSVQTDGQNFVLLTPLVVTQAIHVDHRLWHRVWSGPDDLPKILRIKLNLLGFLTVVPCCTHCQNLWSWYDIMCTYNQTILCTSIRCFKIKI